MELKGPQGKFKTLKLEANPSSVREACTGNPSARSKNANKRPRIEHELGHPCACVSACALEHTLLRFFFSVIANVPACVRVQRSDFVKPFCRIAPL